MNYLRFVAFSALLLMACAEAAWSGELYRYVNDKGVTVIDDKVPPRFVPKGYDILDNRTMALIRRVPRQLSEEELRMRDTDEARAQLKAEEQRRLQAWDESLLLRYSTVEDIKAARERALRDLQVRISILKSNLITIKSNIEREQQKAADLERRGLEVPEDLLKNIDIMRLEIEDTEQSIAMRREEIVEVKDAFQRDIERFETLADRVRMRRQGGQTGKSARSQQY